MYRTIRNPEAPSHRIAGTARNCDGLILIDLGYGNVDALTMTFYSVCAAYTYHTYIHTQQTAASPHPSLSLPTPLANQSPHPRRLHQRHDEPIFACFNGQSYHVDGYRWSQIDQRNRKVAVGLEISSLEGSRVNGGRCRHVVIQLKIELRSHGISVDDEGALSEAGRCWENRFSGNLKGKWGGGGSLRGTKYAPPVPCLMHLSIRRSSALWKSSQRDLLAA